MAAQRSKHNTETETTTTWKPKTTTQKPQAGKHSTEA
jgi:hypothetical protein